MRGLARTKNVQPEFAIGSQSCKEFIGFGQRGNEESFLTLLKSIRTTGDDCVVSPPNGRVLMSTASFRSQS